MRYSISDYSRTAAGKGWGKGWPICTAKSQTAVVTAPLSQVRVTVHKRIARLVFLLLAETERRGYLARSGQTWGGNCRAIAGTQTPSNHSWWLAVDLNSLANPYVLKKAGRPVTDMPAWLPLLWNAFGFAWGGDYSGAKADAMHLEFMGSPEDADDMTALAEQRLAKGLGGTAGGLPNQEEDDMPYTLDQISDAVVEKLMRRPLYMDVATEAGLAEATSVRFDQAVADQYVQQFSGMPNTPWGPGNARSFRSVEKTLAAIQGQLAGLALAREQAQAGQPIDLDAIEARAKAGAMAGAAEVLAGGVDVNVTVGGSRTAADGGRIKADGTHVPAAG